MLRSPLLALLRRARGPGTDAAPVPAGNGLLVPGTPLGNLRIERLIARGAMGALYLAADPANDIAVAVKTLLLPGAQGDARTQARERFMHEAQAASRLVHPDIVAVLGWGDHHGQPFIVMEYLAGTDLTRYTRPGRLLPEPLALTVVARVADALAYAHRQGVLHRDVKPANVMLDLPTMQVKLTDFGIAHLADAEATRSGVVLGSPVFMAPEILAGARADARGDIYALGVTLFQLLTARLPFEGPTMGELLRAVTSQPPLALAALRPDLPVAVAAPLAALLANALERDPARRAADAGIWASALREVAARWPTAPGSR